MEEVGGRRAEAGSIRAEPARAGTGPRCRWAEAGEERAKRRDRGETRHRTGAPRPNRAGESREDSAPSRKRTCSRTPRRRAVRAVRVRRRVQEGRKDPAVPADRGVRGDPAEGTGRSGGAWNGDTTIRTTSTTTMWMCRTTRKRTFPTTWTTREWGWVGTCMETEAEAENKTPAAARAGPAESWTSTAASVRHSRIASSPVVHGTVVGGVPAIGIDAHSCLW